MADVRERRDPLTRFGVALAVVGAVLLVAFARSSREAGGSIPPRYGVDHWDSAYGIYVCGTFIPPLVDIGEERGIHTHADGVIHIHPRTPDLAGENATLGRFAEQVGLTLGDALLGLPNGRTYRDGDNCGGSPGTVRVARWSDATRTAGEPEVTTENVSEIRFRKDGEAFTIAFAPNNAKLPPPETANRLPALRE